MSAIRIGEDLIHYEVLGRGRPVILLHSWLGSWRYWIPTMQHLQLKYRVYALDLYGFGDSVKNPNRYSLEHQVQLLQDFTEQLGIPKVALVGHGLGALVAAEFARQYQDKVPRMLVVNAPLFNPGNLEVRARAFSQAAEKAKKPVASTAPVSSSAPTISSHPNHERTVMSASAAMRAALAEAARMRDAAKANPDSTLEKASAPTVTLPTHNPLKSVIGAATPETLLGKAFSASESNYKDLKISSTHTDPRAIRQSIANFDSGNFLDALLLLSIPVAMVHGVEDKLIPVPDEEVWTYLTSDSKAALHPIPLQGVRHFPMLEYDRFLRLVSDFLEAEDVSKLEIKERWTRRTR